MSKNKKENDFFIEGKKLKVIEKQTKDNHKQTMVKPTTNERITVGHVIDKEEWGGTHLETIEGHNQKIDTNYNVEVEIMMVNSGDTIPMNSNSSTIDIIPSGAQSINISGGTINSNAVLYRLKPTNK